jgi:hypothetical protein
VLNELRPKLLTRVITHAVAVDFTSTINDTFAVPSTVQEPSNSPVNAPVHVGVNVEEEFPILSVNLLMI